MAAMNAAKISAPSSSQMMQEPVMAAAPPPKALAGAMMKDKKPFTYTPGGLNLAEIKYVYFYNVDCFLIIGTLHVGHLECSEDCKEMLTRREFLSLPWRSPNQSQHLILHLLK